MASIATKVLISLTVCGAGAALVIFTVREPDTTLAKQRLQTSVEAMPVATQSGLQPVVASPSPKQALYSIAVPVPSDEEPPLSSHDVVAHFDTWAALARAGDIDAARRIHDSLANCQRAAGAKMGVAADSTDTSPEAGRKRLQAEWFRKQCGDYRPEHYSRLLDVTEAGARAGSDYLRAEYYSLDPLRNGEFNPEQFEKYKTNAQRFLGELVDAGNPDGYLLMSDAYAAGRIVSRDETTAYAYYLAWQQAGRNDRQSPPSASAPYYQNLSADQIKQGQELSRIIQQKDSTQ